MAWTNSASSCLIDLYRSHEVLCNVSNPLYHKKSARITALEAIVKELQEVRPGTTVKDVTTKINSLRTQFSKELRDLKTKASGSGVNEMEYAPKMTFFTELLFLQDQLESRRGVSNVRGSATSATYGNTDMEDSSQLPEVSEQQPDLEEPSLEVCVTPSTHLPGPSRMKESSSSTEGPVKKKMKKQEIPEEAITVETETLRAIGKSLQTIAGKDESSTPTTSQVFANFLAAELDSFKDDRRGNACKRAMLKVSLDYQEQDDDL